MSGGKCLLGIVQHQIQITGEIAYVGIVALLQLGVDLTHGYGTLDELKVFGMKATHGQFPQGVAQGRTSDTRMLRRAR